MLLVFGRYNTLFKNQTTNLNCARQCLHRFRVAACLTAMAAIALQARSAEEGRWAGHIHVVVCRI